MGNEIATYRKHCRKESTHPQWQPEEPTNLRLAFLPSCPASILGNDWHLTPLVDFSPRSVRRRRCHSEPSIGEGRCAGRRRRGRESCVRLRRSVETRGQQRTPRLPETPSQRGGRGSQGLGVSAFGKNIRAEPRHADEQAGRGSERSEPSGTRTRDPVIKSHMLYHLSYRLFREILQRPIVTGNLQHWKWSRFHNASASPCPDLGEVNPSCLF